MQDRIGLEIRMFCPVSQRAMVPAVTHSHTMFTEACIAALLVDEEQADEVWIAWHSGAMSEGAARIAWLMIAGLFWPDD